MAVFSIVTERVKSVAEDVSNLSSSSSSVVNSISGYDTTNEDNFDFASAKSAIEHNVEGMKTKVSNTSVLLDAVVSTHSSLQDSVSDSGRSGNSNSGGYNYFSGGNYSSGGSRRGSNFSGGNINSPIASANLTSTSGIESNALLGELNGYSDNLTALSGIPSTVNSIESIIQDNPSAYQKLLEELGEVESTIGNAESTLNKELEVVLSSNGIKVDTVDKLLQESMNKPLLVIESLSNTPRIVQYIKDAIEVALKHNIEVRYFSLDNIIDTSNPTTVAEEIPDEFLVIEDDIPVENVTPEENEEIIINEDELEESFTKNQPIETLETNTSSEEKMNEEEKEKTSVITPTNISYISEVPKEEINKNEIQNDKEDSSEESKEIIITGTEDKDSNENKEGIKDKVQYNKLVNIPTKENVKYNIMNSPITLIIKGNLIMNAINGIMTKEKLEEFIKTSGIDIINTIN